MVILRIINDIVKDYYYDIVNNILPFFMSIFLKENGNEFQELFPKYFKLDVVKGIKNIYSEPILPDIDLENRKQQFIV